MRSWFFSGFLLFFCISIVFSSNNIFGERQNWGVIEFDAINEASGLVASIKNKGVFWTHNDSGDRNRIYAFNSEGKHLGIYFLDKCRARDWEDIAIGPGPLLNEQYIYIGNIGDNKSIFTNKYIYRCKEPSLNSNEEKMTQIIYDCETINFQYEDGNRDAEILMIDPVTKDIIIISKREESVHIYNLPYPQNTKIKITANLIGVKDFYPDIVNEDLEMMTGGDISNNGEEILLKSYLDIFQFRRNNDDSIIESLNNEMKLVHYIPEVQGEAVCWHPEGFGYFTISEEKMDIESTLYFYPKLEGCMDAKADNYNPYAVIEMLYVNIKKINDVR